MAEGLRRLLIFSASSGASSVLSIISVILFAADLSPRGYVALNLALLGANAGSQLAAGFDSAAARQLGMGLSQEDAAIGNALTWRLVVALVATPLIFAVSIAALGRTTPQTYLLMIGTIASNSIALGLMAVSLIVPQARGRARAYGQRQFSYYGPLAIAALTTLWMHSTTWALAVTIVSGACGSVLSALVLLLGDSYRVKSTSWGDRRYRQLSGAISLSGTIFTLGERADVFVAAAMVSSSKAGSYALASRLAVVGAIIASAAQAMYISRYGEAAEPTDLVEQWRRDVPLFVVVLVAVVLWSLVAPVIAAVLFRGHYAVNLYAVLALCAPYWLYMLYSPYSLALAGLGYRRPVIVSAVLGTAVKVVITVVAADRDLLWLLYLGSLLGGVAGAGATYHYRIGPDSDFLGASNA